MEREFLNRFYSTRRSVSMLELTSTKQRKDEPVVDYINHWRSLSLDCKDRVSELSAVDMCIQVTTHDSHNNLVTCWCFCLVNNHGQLIICPIIHAQALEPTPQGARKVVLATSVAETSLLMLTGIHYVIDSGFCMIKSYHPTAVVESALLSPISKAMAVQRAEQAGSMCATLYICCYLNDLQDQTAPEEVQRSNK
ncbi:hypothetical protein L3X38_039816 [Prunus dulcis]|uniref:RNA helicase n=1 Tax=Prunus dulcis TaxID=3755 RepID=A0AAD4YTH2_PRUDU|nr:hypothetical protein L3X38_039816 [Prunus dulcis]